MSIVKIIDKWIFGKNVIGIALFPFIFIKKSFSDRVSKERLNQTINHEKIHMRQQLEMLVIPFYVWYLIEFLIRMIITPSKAYRNISFEKEAHENDADFDYLKKRKFWSFLKYI
jgi:hypothetical protein